MYILVVLCYLRKYKKHVHIHYNLSFFLNILDLWLVESTDMETMDILTLKQHDVK